MLRTTKVIFPAAILAVLAVGAANAAETVDTLFRKAVEATGVRYVEARTDLVARPDEVTPLLERTIKTSKDWHEQVVAEAIQGWIRYPALYRELWDWEPPSELRRYENSNPYLASAAKRAFSREQEKAVPLMLELLWKRGESHYGALPELLSESKVETAIPVLVELMTSQDRAARLWGGPEALGRFGPQATPYLLAALKEPKGPSKVGLIKALGLTGDVKAVAELRRVLTGDADGAARAAAAASLGALKQYAALRQDVSALDPRTQEEVLRVLGEDQSEETRGWLHQFAATAESASLRFAAVKALLNKPTTEDLAAVCEIAPKERDENARVSMYIYLGAACRYQKSAAARKLFLQSLKDKSTQIRVRAVEGLQYYDDAEVTRALLPLFVGEDLVKRTALWVLKKRTDPAIAGAVLPLLGDADAVIRQYAIEALRKNPTAKALEPLIGRLGDPDVHARRLAVEAVTQIGGQQALAALEKARLTEQDKTVNDRIEAGIRALSAQPGGGKKTER